MMLRAIIVDDEELSVRRLNKMLADSGEIESCYSFMNPFEACDFVKENVIDIAFLDISMPEMDGITLSNTIKAINQSIAIVFVTSYDNYAVTAFDVSAMDYLLKPVTAQRLAQAIGKLKKGQRRTASQRAIGVHLFNELKLFKWDDESAPLKLRSPKTEELFSFLICKKAVSREEIIETIWDGMAPDKALKNLNSNLYYIRKAMGTDNSDDCIYAGRSEIRIKESGIYCDLYEFNQILVQIRKDSDRNEELFKRAEVLYTGRVLKGKPYEWASEYAQQIEQQYIKLLEVAAIFHKKRKQLQEALHYFDKILLLDAIREDIHYEVIQLCIELGRKNEAIRRYRMLEQILLQEVGTKPDHRITDAILNITR